MAEPKDKTSAGRFAFLDTLQDLPSLPQALVKISRVASDPKASAADLADLILRDQALTLKILRIANSARYALYSQRITTVSRAVMLLGFQSVRAISLGLGAFHLLSALRRGGAVLEGFWRDSMATAVVCQELAGLFGVAVTEEAFVAGLLHDVGKLILAENNPERACDLYGGAHPGSELLEAERAAFGVDHTEVAAELARRWELPEVLRKAMTLHHRHFGAPPTDRGELLAFLVSAAKTLGALLRGDSTDAKDLSSKLARVLRKPVGMVLSVLEGLPERIRDYATFFEIEVDELRDYTLWVEDENRRLTEAIAEQEGERRRIEARQAEMTAVREIHGLLVQGAEPATVVHRALRAAAEIAGARRAVVATSQGDPPEFRRVWAGGDVTPEFLDGFRFPLCEQGIFAEVARSGQPVHVFDTSMPYFARLLTPREAKTLDAPSFAVLPVLRGIDVVAVLYTDRTAGDEPFTDEEIQTLATLADLASLALRG